ncbi:MAG: hypothetical protein ACTHPD_16070 [Rhizomicrobium sp.]
MTLSDLASIATVISGVAVLVSLIYLGLQTRQNTRHTRALLWQGAAERGVSLSLALADEKLCAAFIKQNGETPTPDAIAERQFSLQCTALYIQYDDMFTQWDDGLVSEEQFLRSRASMVRTLAAYPVTREFFVRRVAASATSESRFAAFLRDVIAETDPH